MTTYKSLGAETAGAYALLTSEENAVLTLTASSNLSSAACPEGSQQRGFSGTIKTQGHGTGSPTSTSTPLPYALFPALPNLAECPSYTHCATEHTRKDVCMRKIHTDIHRHTRGQRWVTDAAAPGHPGSHGSQTTSAESSLTSRPRSNRSHRPTPLRSTPTRLRHLPGAG